MAEDLKNVHILSIDEMLETDDVEYATIPTWMVDEKDASGKKTGKKVQGFTRIGSLNADAVVTWRETAEGPAKRTMGVRLFVDSLVDAQGNRIGTQAHYEAFKKKSNAIQEKVLAEIVKLNGMTIKADKDAKND